MARVLVIGNSHVQALNAAYLRRQAERRTEGVDLVYVSFFHEPFTAPLIDEELNPAIAAEASDRANDLIVSMIGGNQHNMLGLVNHPDRFDFVYPNAPDLPLDEEAEILPFGFVRRRLTRMIEPLLKVIRGIRAAAVRPMIHLESPPPVPSEEHILRYPTIFRDAIAEHGVAPAAFRYKLWRAHSDLFREACTAMDVRFIPCPEAMIDQDGMLVRDAWNDDCTHGNHVFGDHEFRQIVEIVRALPMTDPGSNYVSTGRVTSCPVTLIPRSLAGAEAPAPAPAPAPPPVPPRPARVHPHPYTSLPASAFWRKSIADIPADQVDPVTWVPFKITRHDRIATAGSCFAQHIARRLRESGYTFYVTEPAHAISRPDDATEFNYGVFTARYGNIYTPRQLRQLFDRAYGRFRPSEDVWHGKDGQLIDPFRPQIQPGGFDTLAEYQADRARHLARVRMAFENLDVFVFTLGLTEAWRNRADGAVYPLCPGVAGGTFDPARYEFHNFGYDEIRDDLRGFIGDLRWVNPKARVVLTVSPVPLVATATCEHVLTATTYSKAALRVAAEEIVTQVPDVAYFPSYEIITGVASRGQYYAEDLRSIEEAGVSHVMRVFFQHYVHGPSPVHRLSPTVSLAPAAPAPPPADRHTAMMERLVKLNCDEVSLDIR